MQIVNLFLTQSKEWITNIDLLEKLRKLKADECEILYIHSAISFGTPNTDLKRKELLGEIYETLLTLKVSTICMPTFTFSFCNGKDYDPIHSGSKMGALNEYFRKQDGVIRSVDPLMSVALYGKDKDLVTEIGHSSIGENSTFDKIRHKDHVKFLFLGTKIGDCFTYMHYLEWLYNVDYRYDKVFQGKICRDGKEDEEAYSLFVRYHEVLPNRGSYKYEQMMYEQGIALYTNLGQSTISIVEEKTAASAYKICLEKNPYFFVDIKGGKLIKEKTFLLEKEMVAL